MVVKSHNPLFVDSTKFAGDGIRTQFELAGLILYEGEKVHAQVVNGNDHQQIVPLHENQVGIFSGSIYLKHQEEIRFQFIIKNEDKILFMSAERTGRATYLITENWEPIKSFSGFYPKFGDSFESLTSVHSDNCEKKEETPLPEFDSQRKVLQSAVEAIETYFN